MSKPTLSIFTGSKGLGNVFKEQNQIITKFWEFSTPLSSTTGRISLNTGGKVRIIMVQGSHSGTGFDGTNPNDKLGDFIYEMEQWVNANVQSSITYTDSFDTSYSVDCVDWTWTRSFDSPGRILYSIIMKQD